jgi:hypothetical protein
MPLPNFLVLGAAKAGTTSLHQYLRQHPEVYLPRWKELRFFAYDGQPPLYNGPGDKTANQWTTTTLEAYCAYFAAVTNEKAIGEVSPVYLYSERAPERIQHYIPKAKLIAILRDPIDRAYSHFLHFVRDGREPVLNFVQALAKEDQRVRDNWEWSWHYRRVGLYYHQLCRYFERFDRHQIRIYLYEDFQTDPLGLLQDIFRFLGVDESFTPDTAQRHNVSGIQRDKTLAKALLRVRRHGKVLLEPIKPFLPALLWRRGAITLWRLYNRNLIKPPLDPEIRTTLVASYREDIIQLQTLIGRDLSRWLV